MRIIFIDTCTWLKFEDLETNNLFSTSILFSFSSIAITREIQKELKYYSVSKIDFSQVIIYPISDQRLYKEALELGLDESDASLLSNGKIDVDELYLISEDGAILAYGEIHRLNVIQLVDLFQILTALGYIDKTKFYQLIRYLRDQQNITKKKGRDLLNWLKSFR
ncbi:MAG TPA: hypothetical protein VMV49_07865 [Candidatus Deferrimicrobium sp.]|nr:hypothetical protein [Candidatus Deferrimicrobium sp.]